MKFYKILFYKNDYILSNVEIKANSLEDCYKYFLKFCIHNNYINVKIISILVNINENYIEDFNKQLKEDLNQ